MFLAAASDALVEDVFDFCPARVLGVLVLGYGWLLAYVEGAWAQRCFAGTRVFVMSFVLFFDVCSVCFALAGF